MNNKAITLIIGELMKVKGVSTVALVERNGVVIESGSKQDDLDQDSLGTLVATAVGASEALASEFSTGKFEILLSEYANGKILMASVGNHVLAIFVDETAVIGSVRYSLQIHFPYIISALE